MTADLSTPTGRIAKEADRARGYAMKFINDSAAYPSDANLAEVLANCARAPRPEWLPIIRAEVLAWREATGQISRLETGHAADLSVPTGVTRRREPVRRSEWLAPPRAPGPYSLPVGHIVAIEITDDAAHRQFGIGYRSAGEQVWGSGWGSHVVEVLAEDAAGRGWWVEHCDRRSVLVQPEDLLGACDTGPLAAGEMRAYDQVTSRRDLAPGGARSGISPMHDGQVA